MASYVLSIWTENLTSNEIGSVLIYSFNTTERIPPQINYKVLKYRLDFLNNHQYPPFAHENQIAFSKFLREIIQMNCDIKHIFSVMVVFRKSPFAFSIN